MRSQQTSKKKFKPIFALGFLITTGFIILFSNRASAESPATEIIIPTNNNRWVTEFTPLREIEVTTDGLGGQALDYSGIGNNAILRFAPKQASGHIPAPSGPSRSILLDGVDDILSLEEKIGPWGEDFTISAWVKTTNDTAISSNFPIIGVWGGGTGQAFGLDEGLATLTVRGTCIQNSLEVKGTTFVADDQWHHIALTINHSNKTVNIYTDGALEATESISHIATDCGIKPFEFIGGLNLLTGWYFEGQIDELLAYNRVLNASQIAAQFNQGDGVFGSAETGLIAAYHFDEADHGSPANPMPLEVAIQAAIPGDLFWLNEGVYNNFYYLPSTTNGTLENPIVYRAKPGAHAHIDGGFDMRGEHIWLWGVEVSDVNDINYGNAVRFSNVGSRVINSVIHHDADASGIGAWDTGDHQLVYGNIVYENGWIATNRERPPHNIYTQNTFDPAKQNYKYFINNILLDSIDADRCQACTNFHGYTASGGDARLSGFHFENNILRGGMFVIGGAWQQTDVNPPSEHNYVLNNYFFKSERIQFGHRRPAQATFQDNFVVLTTLRIQKHWGEAGGQPFTQDMPNVFTNNTFLYPNAFNHIWFSTAQYIGGGQDVETGAAGIQSADIFNANTYSEPFTADYHADNKVLGQIDWATWRSETAAAGNAFDTNSQVTDNPEHTKIVLIPNEYEAGRAHLAVYNLDLFSSLTIDLSSVIESGQPWAIRDPRDAFGTPILSGTSYDGPVQLPLYGAQFCTYLITADGDGSASGQPAENCEGNGVPSAITLAQPVGVNPSSLPILIIVMTAISLAAATRFTRKHTS